MSLLNPFGRNAALHEAQCCNSRLPKVDLCFGFSNSLSINHSLGGWFSAACPRPVSLGLAGANVGWLHCCDNLTVAYVQLGNPDLLHSPPRPYTLTDTLSSRQLACLSQSGCDTATGMLLQTCWCPTHQHIPLTHHTIHTTTCPSHCTSNPPTLFLELRLPLWIMS